MSGSDFRWRSPLSGVLDDSASWTEFKDSDIVQSFAKEPNSPPAAICDLSPLMREGAKGECASAAPPVNFSRPETDGGLCCRLGEDELFILASANGEGGKIREEDMPHPTVVIPRRDSHCQIGLCGEQASAVLARVCAVPPPQDHELAQTRVADVSAIIISDPRAKLPAFHILTDSGYASHLWHSLQSAVQAVQGAPIGHTQWKSLFSDSRSSKSKKSEK